MEILSYLRITGKLDENTPVDVICEIAVTHNIDEDFMDTLDDINALIDEINREDVPAIGNQIMKSDYTNMARFINFNVDWSINELEVAYKFVKNFINPKEFKNLRSDFKYGLQTPENPNNFNLILVYAACRHFDIELNTDVSELEIVSKLRQYLESKDLIIESITCRLINYDIPELLNIKLYSNNPILGMNTNGIIKRKNKLNKPTYEDLLASANNITTYYPTKTAIKSYEPKDSSDAITIGSIYYQCDLSGENNPIKSLDQIREGDIKINLVQKFNIAFPPSLYPNEYLNLLLEKEGYSTLELEYLDPPEKYQILQMIVLSDNFYHGLMNPYVNEMILSTFDNVSSLNPVFCLSHGSIQDQKYYIFTYVELYTHFKTSNVLTDPINKKELSPIETKKMMYLTGLDKYTDETFDHHEIRGKMHTLIKLLSDNSSKNIIKSIINKINEDKTGMNKEIVENIIRLFTELAMNMRGWNGEKEYPIKQSYNLDQGIIYRRVSEKLHELSIYSKNFQDMVGLFYKLPLVKYRDGNYLPSNQESGLTIKDRLDIIQHQPDNVNSCIRLSSNYILATIYLNSQLLSIAIGFDIKDVRYIS